MHTFSVPVWFNLNADSKGAASRIVLATITGGTRLGADGVEHSLDFDDIIEYDENGDEVKS